MISIPFILTHEDPPMIAPSTTQRAGRPVRRPVRRSGLGRKGMPWRKLLLATDGAPVYRTETVRSPGSVPAPFVNNRTSSRLGWLEAM